MASTITIGKFEIEVPEGHIYQSPLLPPTYDYVPWNLIGALLEASFTEECALIDIGANVGDSLAHFRRFSEAKALCIEPDIGYFQLLEANARLMNNAEAKNALVAPTNMVDKTSFGSDGSTGWSIPAVTDESVWRGEYASVRKIIEWADGPALIKTDTDGFDGQIVKALLPHLSGNFIPIIFFEGPLESQHKEEKFDDYLVACDGLMGQGYKLLLLTNIGMPYSYVGTSREALRACFNALTIGLHRHMALCHYFDVIALHPALSSDLHSLQRPWPEELFRRT